MDVFHKRIEIDEAATIVRAALDRQLLGETPSAIFHDLGLMRARFATLQAAFPASALHAVAIKANPLVEVLREVVQAGGGLEAASIEEVELALAASCPADRIVFDSPAKTLREIEQALCHGIYLNADSFDELERIAAVQSAYYSTSVVGLRVNAMVGGGTIRATSVAEASSKFGVSLHADRQRIIEAFAQYPWLRGLHVHVGSQGCGLELLVEAVARIESLRRDVVLETCRDVPFVDIGGGLPAIYRTGATAPTPAEYCTAIEERCPELFSSDVQIVTEFGRCIQATCGMAASRVEYVKPAQQIAVIHLGADLLLRPVYRPEDWQHEFFVLGRDGRPKKNDPRPVTIVGPLCFAGDVVARDVLLPAIEPGDWIVVRDVGAYTLSMWSRHCSRGIPAVIGYDPQQAESLRVMRAAESPADVVQFWGDGSSRKNRSENANVALQFSQAAMDLNVSRR
jgi:diaminopimelate decarboxylase